MVVVTIIAMMKAMVVADSFARCPTRTIVCLGNTILYYYCQIMLSLKSISYMTIQVVHSQRYINFCNLPIKIRFER